MANKRKRIIIEHDDSISPEGALWRVMRVVQGGRVSGDGTEYCYVTRFSDNTLVGVRSRRKGQKSDSFVVWKEAH